MVKVTDRTNMPSDYSKTFPEHCGQRYDVKMVERINGQEHVC